VKLPRAPCKDAATKDAATKDAATKDAATKDTATKDTATKDTAAAEDDGWLGVHPPIRRTQRSCTGGPFSRKCERVSAEGT